MSDKVRQRCDKDKGESGMAALGEQQTSILAEVNDRLLVGKLRCPRQTANGRFAALLENSFRSASDAKAVAGNPLGFSNNSRRHEAHVLPAKLAQPARRVHTRRNNPAWQPPFHCGSSSGYEPRSATAAYWPTDKRPSPVR